MNLADRIQHLRKSKGISQEELADRLGVSRQAISKWESEQSMPDLDKIIHISDFFGVTTDYLLKGIEPPPPASRREKPHAGVFAAVGTALCAVGLLAAAIIWYEEQTAAAFAGCIMMVMGCMIYAVGLSASEPASRPAARRQFWGFGVWILPFIPLAVLSNALTWGRFGKMPLAPYPTYYPDGIVLFVVLYAIIGLAGTWFFRRKWKKEETR